jgi:Holliday junction resolvase RusA-like endonuclease
MGRRPILTGPVGLTIRCYFIGKTGWRTSKPDWDNVAKLCCDGMNKVVYLDDAQIAHVIVSKINGLEDKVEVTVRPLMPNSENGLTAT